MSVPEPKTLPRTLIAVVVTCNRLTKLQVTLARLLGHAPEHLTRVVLVDNGSTDGTAEWLGTQDDPRLTVLRSEKNLGGSGGFEMGIRHTAEVFDPDWMLIQDDDARPEAGALALFHARDRSAHEGWVTAVHFPDGSLCEMNRPLINPFWHRGGVLKALRHGRDGYHLGLEDYAVDAPVQEVDGGSFVGFFVSRRAVQSAGYPDPALFLYGDDALYSLEIRAQGGTIAFDPALRYEHDCATLGEGEQIILPMWKCYYFYRNLILVYKRAAGWAFWPAFGFMALRWRRKAPAYGAQAEAYRRVLRRAMADGIKGRIGQPHSEVVKMVEEMGG
ncbi:glycosyltransferase [Alphaproteobacteria bacterium KMM 3653]|uniref:Glycosyltransferase n=1 Tax=Harenicola maris TaxID=2841044 RepID=A0AAP2CQH8_9RHOB|nr:glycosyltransferase [Harenicola maris]